MYRSSTADEQARASCPPAQRGCQKSGPSASWRLRYVRKRGWYGWKPSSSSNLSIRVVQAYCLIEIRQAIIYRAIRADSISIDSIIPPTVCGCELATCEQRHPILTSLFCKLCHFTSRDIYAQDLSLRLLRKFCAALQRPWLSCIT